MTLRTVLLSLQALLAAAEPDDPQDAVVARQVGCSAPLTCCLVVMFVFFLLTYTELIVAAMVSWDDE